VIYPFVLPNLAVDGTTSGSGSAFRRSVDATTTGNINLNLDYTANLVDGVMLNVGDRILVKDQTNSTENGIYTVESGTGATIRSEDFSSGSTCSSALILVQKGTENENTGWLCTNDDGSDVIGKNNLVFQQFSGIGVDGDVNGPASSTDNAIVRWDGTSGKLAQNSGVTVADNNSVAGVSYAQFNDTSAPSNPSNGQGRLYKKTGNDGLFWKPDSAGAEVDLTNSEVNTASNQGVGGVGVFIQKTGLNLEFRNINSGSSKISITNDRGNNEIDIDAVEANFSLNNIGGTLNVSKGGTGATSFTSGNILQGNAITATSIPTNQVVTLTGNQTLTNKTITASSNNVTANGLRTATTTVNVSASAAPTSGQVLTATSGTAATWQSPSGFSKTIRLPHTWAISGEIKTQQGDTYFLIPFFVSLASGQKAVLSSCRHKINSGKSVTVTVQRNDSNVTGFTGLSVTTTATTTDPADVALANNDKIAIVVGGVSGTPKNLSFTLFIDYTV